MAKDISTKISQVPVTFEPWFNTLTDSSRMTRDELHSDISGVLAIVDRIKATVNTVREDSTKFATSAQVRAIRSTEVKALRALMIILRLIENIETQNGLWGERLARSIKSSDEVMSRHHRATQGLLYSANKSSKNTFEEQTETFGTYLEDITSFLVDSVAQSQSEQVTTLKSYHDQQARDVKTHSECQSGDVAVRLERFMYQSFRTIEGYGNQKFGILSRAISNCATREEAKSNVAAAEDHTKKSQETAEKVLQHVETTADHIDSCHRTTDRGLCVE